MNMQVLVPRPWNEVMSEGGASASPSRKITCDSWGLNGRPCRGIVKVKHFDTAEAAPCIGAAAIRGCVPGGFFAFTGLQSAVPKIRPLVGNQGRR